MHTNTHTQMRLEFHTNMHFGLLEFKTALTPLSCTFSMLTLQGSQAKDTELVIVCLFSNLLAVVVTVCQDHL